MNIKTIWTRLLDRRHPAKCSAVIVAAGSSQRMGCDKLMYDLCGKPVLIRAVSAFESCANVEEIVVVTRNDRIMEIADACKKYGLTKVTKVISGGETRTESALAGVSNVSPKAQLIAIHDGARPFVTPELITKTVVGARNLLSVVPVLPNTDTVKGIDDKGMVTATFDRNKTVCVQTPQVFNADLIKGALTRAVREGLTLTDDCSAIEMMGVKTYTVQGEADNIKLTTPRDLAIGELILNSRGNRA